MAKTTLFTRITSQARLARIYAEDGALRTAARILAELSAEITEIAVEREVMLNAAIAEHVSGGAN